MSFESLGLTAELLRAVHENAFTEPTEAQAFVVPRVLAGANVLVAAQTGSGKTVAYALAALQRLASLDAAQRAQAAATAGVAEVAEEAEANRHAAAAGADAAECQSIDAASTSRAAAVPVQAEDEPLPAGDSGFTAGRTDGSPVAGGTSIEPDSSRTAGNERTPRVLILVPTRELCAQVTEIVRSYGKYLPLRCVQIFGGVGMQPQVVALRSGVDVVVATPGRLLDHVQRGSVDLSRLQLLVLDEADRMLDMGFRDVIARVLARLPEQRQSVLLSATYGDEVASLAASIATGFELLEVAPTRRSLDHVRQQFYAIEPPHKADALAFLFHRHGWQRALVYTRTKHGADRLAKKLYRAGIGSDSIHGNKGQGARARAIGRFKAGEIAALVATDVAARALDIVGLPLVVNFDLPHVSEDYLHRVARAGDASNVADVVALVAEDELPLLAGVGRLLGEEFTPQPLEGFVPRVLVPRERPAAGPERQSGPVRELAEDEVQEDDEDDRQPFAAAGFGAQREQAGGDPRGKRNRRRRRGRADEFDGPRTPTDLLPSGGILDAFSDDPEQPDPLVDEFDDDTQPAWLSEQAARFDPADDDDEFSDDDEDNIGNRISDPPQDFRNRTPFAGARGKKGPPPRGPRGPSAAPVGRAPGYPGQAGPAQTSSDRPAGPRNDGGRPKPRRQRRGPRSEGVPAVAIAGEGTAAPGVAGEGDARRPRSNRRNRQRNRERPRAPQGGGAVDSGAIEPGNSLAATGNVNGGERRGPPRSRNGPRGGNAGGSPGNFAGGKGGGNRGRRPGRAVEITHGGSRRRFGFPSDWSKNIERTPRERLDYVPAPLRASSWEGGAPSSDSLRRDSQRVAPKIIERKKGRRLLTLKRDGETPSSE